MSRETDVFFHFFFLIGSIFCWLFYAEKPRQKYAIYLGCYLLVTLLVDGAASLIMLNQYLAKLFISNLFLYHILVPIQCFLIIQLFDSIIKTEWVHKVSRIVIFLFVFVSILLSLTVQGFKEYNSYAILLKHLITIVLILIYFYEIISTTPYTRIYLQPVFWISVGFLFHSTLNILLEGFSNYFHTYSNQHYSTLYFLYSVSNYCLFLLFGVGIISPHLNGKKWTQHLLPITS